MSVVFGGGEFWSIADREGSIRAAGGVSVKWYEAQLSASQREASYEA